MRFEYDFLIIGSGIAGLTYALKVAEQGKVLIITKAGADESNTKYAQGGIAAVMHAADSIEKHVQDTLVAGAGLCNEEIVRIVIKEGVDRVKEIIEWGTQFDKTPSGEFDLAREGGHSEYRVLHYKDITGAEIERALLQQLENHPNITLTTHYYAVDIITQHHLGKEVRKSTSNIKCYGAYALHLESARIDTILAKTTLMATGGAGHVYKTTTNPIIATGDGIAMAYRAKAEVEGMEFIQFHPTAFYNPQQHPAFLISEAVRGFGAILRNSKGEDFMPAYDIRASLAPRDIVARAIDSEMKKQGSEHVYLDCRHLDKAELLRHFPNIYAHCLASGIDIKRDLIPVAPAMHYLCGGIKVDEMARTNIENLFAVGECSSTGLHGANRLASNSLLEALVFAHRASIAATAQKLVTTYKNEVPDWNAEGTSEPKELVLISHNLREMQAIMSDYVGIVRSDLRLKRAMERLDILYKETEELYKNTIISQALCELRNLIQVSYIIIKQASMRQHSVGLHYNIDHLN